MVINEFAQWAVILVLAISVLGLVRQLGQFLVPRKEQLLYLGPNLGRKLPESLLDGVPRNELARLIKTSAAGLGLIAALNDRCNGCRGMVSQLQLLGAPEVPVIAIVDTSDPDYLAYLREFFTYVIQDEGGERVHHAGIIATPFVLAVDADLTVKHRGIAGSLHELLAEWTGGSTIDDAGTIGDSQQVARSISTDSKVALTETTLKR